MGFVGFRPRQTKHGVRYKHGGCLDQDTGKHFE
jgi:hypothetical protein